MRSEVSYRVFLAAAIPMRITLTPERLKSIFLLLDSEAQGCITFSSIKQYVGETVTDAEIEDMIFQVYNFYHHYAAASNHATSIELEKDVMKVIITEEIFYYFICNSYLLGDIFNITNMYL